MSMVESQQVRQDVFQRRFIWETLTQIWLYRTEKDYREDIKTDTGTDIETIETDVENDKNRLRNDRTRCEMTETDMGKIKEQTEKRRSAVR